MGFNQNDIDRIAPKLGTFEKKPVEWLIQDLVQFGSITLIDGDPGSGKSNLAQFMASCASVGRDWIDGTHIPVCEVLIIDGENNIGRSVRARVENCDGEIASFRVIHWFEPTKESPKQIFKLPDHLAILEEIVKAAQIRVIIVDTMFNHISRSVNANGDQEIRSALTPLSYLAEKYNVAIILLRHLNKSIQGPAMYRGGGSIAINAVARSVILCAKDPTFPKRCVMAHVKTNDGPICDSWTYHIEGMPDKSCKIVFGSRSEITADELVAGLVDVQEDHSADDALFELQEILANGPKKFDEVLGAANDVGISLGALRRAKKNGKIDSKKVGKGPGSYWEWSLPATKPFLT